ncbi:MAG: hypothetical protein R3325_00495 [Thermoanaerobaculia bacterium]|nr:hypothetical protein [Thermoanaerobaculia bacterium]
MKELRNRAGLEALTLVGLILGVGAMGAAEARADACGREDRAPLPSCAKVRDRGDESTVTNRCSYRITVKWDIARCPDARLDIYPDDSRTVGHGGWCSLRQISCCPRYSRCTGTTAEPSPGAAAPLSAPDAEPESSPAPTDSVRVILKNCDWDRVRVNARVGPSSDCEKGADRGIKVLGEDETWQFRCLDTNVLCWRRDRNPDHPDGTWTGWTSHHCLMQDHEWCV